MSRGEVGRPQKAYLPKRMRRKRTSGVHGASVRTHSKPANEILPKWRLELLRLTKEALQEVEKETAASILRNSPRPLSESHSPGAAEAHS